MAAQRILLDLATQENALLVGMIGHNLENSISQPGATLAGLADMGVRNFTSAGKILLDLAAAETTLVVDGVKEGFAASSGRECCRRRGTPPRGHIRSHAKTPVGFDRRADSCHGAIL